MGYEVCWAAWGLCTRTYIIHSVSEPLDLGLYQYSTWHQFHPKEYIKVRGQLFARIFKIRAARRIASGKLWSGKYMVSKSCKLLLVCTMNVLVSVWAISTIYPFSSRLSPLVGRHFKFMHVKGQLLRDAAQFICMSEKRKVCRMIRNCQVGLKNYNFQNCVIPLSVRNSNKSNKTRKMSASIKRNK